VLSAARAASRRLCGGGEEIEERKEAICAFFAPEKPEETRNFGYCFS
jgi:hypothetical protein